jgi:hypothetical protein
VYNWFNGELQPSLFREPLNDLEEKYKSGFWKHFILQISTTSRLSKVTGCVQPVQFEMTILSFP